MKAARLFSCFAACFILTLDAKAGKTYFLHYHAFFLKEANGVAFFDKVDEDKGLYLVRSSSLAVSKLSR